VIFAQLEDHINVQCQKLVTEKQSAARWKRRRLWDDLNVNELYRVPFMKRVSLLTQRGHGAYNKVKQLYDNRCSIAHGGTYTPVNVAVEAAEMYRIARELRA
jgi:hypothetical protein